MFWRCRAVFPEILLARYFVNCLGDFHQIYNFDSVGDKDELIRFSGQKVRGRGQTMIKRRRRTHIDGSSRHASGTTYFLQY